MRQVFSPEYIGALRKVISDNLPLLRRTRPNPNARHLAGFHRFAALEPMHRQAADHAAVQEAMQSVFQGRAFGTIGLSDITVNRSQNWHTDLLRGPYADHLTGEMCWSDPAPSCVKALIYLQDSASLRVIPGSHLRPVDLEDDAAVIPGEGVDVRAVEVAAGDLVLIDLRLIHRGSEERDLAGMGLEADAKMMVSTVFGCLGPSIFSMSGNSSRKACSASWPRARLSRARACS